MCFIMKLMRLISSHLTSSHRTSPQVTGASTSEGSGQFKATYNTEETGAYTIQVKLNNVNVEGSPFDCTLDPGPPDPTRSTATGTSAQIIASQGGSNCPDGKVCVGDVTVLLRDQFNNDCSSGRTRPGRWST
jgi:hypothetical protein